MSNYGLSIWDASQNLVLTIDNRVIIHMGNYIIPEGSGIVDISVPGVVNDGTWMVTRFGVGISFEIFTDFIRANRTYNFTHLNGGNVLAGQNGVYEFHDYFRLYRW